MRVYIHIPFCASKCPYCAFGSFSDFSLVRQYFDALNKDLNHQLKEFLKAKKQIKSIFFGGGTPSMVGVKFYEKIMDLLLSYCAKNAEITFEANPNSAKLEWLKSIKNLGANRISFGTQSFDEKKLKFLGRTHSSADTFMAIENALRAGFERINVDFIYGTKLDSKKLLSSELEGIEKLKNLGVKHISAYALTLEQNTPFYAHKNYAKEAPILANFMIKGLKNLGFLQYEISNFAQIGYECEHNLGYWMGDEYIGVGAFSVGCVGKTRLYAHSLIENYINEPLFRKSEYLSDDEWSDERLLLGLRSKLGVDEKYIKNKEILEFLEKDKKILRENGRVFNKNFLLADELACVLC